MPNHHGDFIWYELMTRQPEQAGEFYAKIFGWKITGPHPQDPLGYRQFSSSQNFVGGIFPLTQEMCDQGAKPMWMGYVGVDDVDTCAIKLEKLGGSILMPAFDIPDVGRIAMVADPLGTPFYIMRGAIPDHASNSFQADTIGHCMWNELATTDSAGALEFYGQLFGWKSTEAMPMGEIGEYQFLDHHDVRMGAVSPFLAEGESPIWTYYFYVDDVDAKATLVKQLGGKVLHEPHEVPTGHRIFIGQDPEGVTFAAVGPAAQ